MSKNRIKILERKITLYKNYNSLRIKAKYPEIKFIIPKSDKYHQQIKICRKLNPKKLLIVYLNKTIEKCKQQ